MCVQNALHGVVSNICQTLPAGQAMEFLAEVDEPNVKVG